MGEIFFGKFGIGKWYHFFRVAIKLVFLGVGLYLILIPTSTPLASIPDRIRYGPKVSADAKNQLHEWMRFTYCTWGRYEFVRMESFEGHKIPIYQICTHWKPPIP